MKSIDKFSQKGFRLVGIAKGELNESSLEEYDPNKLQWLGYLTISDPVRSNVAKVLKETIESGIKVKVITGDYIETAKNVLLQLGIDLKKEQILSGEQFEELTSSQKTEAVKTTVLFYRISPDQKYDIVDILQKAGEVVGMMGDGINDSPALKKADVGIVVNNAAEISKQTADMVLIDSNFQSIIEAIKEGRGVLENIRKIITFLLTDSFAEVILILLSLIFNYPIPLTALQILYINMIADSLPDMALSFEKNKIKSIKSQVDQNLFPKKNISLILIIGIIANVVIFLAYTYLLNLKYDIDTIRSFIFFCLAIDSLIFVYPIKVLNSKLSWNELFDNKLLNLSVLLGIFMICFAFVFQPLSKLLDLKELSVSLIILSMGLVFLKLLLIQLIKTFTNKLEIK